LIVNTVYAYYTVGLYAYTQSRGSFVNCDIFYIEQQLQLS